MRLVPPPLPLHGDTNFDPPTQIPVPASTHTGGLLHEFRKKTMQKIVKYAASSPSAPQTSVSPTSIFFPQSPTAAETTTVINNTFSNSGSGPRRAIIMSPSKGKDGVNVVVTDRLSVQLQRFDEQDKLLQQLQKDLIKMLDELHVAFVSMGRVVEIFTQTLRYDPVSYQYGVDYLRAMQVMRREHAHLMEQAIRFTVLDPLTARLERHTHIKQQIQAWQRLQIEIEEGQLAIDFLIATRQDKTDKQTKAEVKLSALIEQNDVAERELIKRLDESTNTQAVKHQIDLFTTMRLQLAIFFYQTNNSLFTRLSDMEQEIVQGVRVPSDKMAEQTNKPAMEDSSFKSTTPTIVSQDSFTDLESEDDEEDRESRKSMSDDEEALRVSIITLDDFEQGIRLSVDLTQTLDKHERHSQPSSPRNSLTSSVILSVPELLALASRPIVDVLHADETEEGSKSQSELISIRLRQSQDAADALNEANERSRTLSSPVYDQKERNTMFSSIRKSLQETFGKNRQLPPGAVSSAVGITPVDKAKSTQQTRLTRSRDFTLSQEEWIGVEASLWELDTVEPNTQLMSDHPCFTGSMTLMSILEYDQPLFFDCVAYLQFHEMTRLAKVNRRLHDCMVNAPAVWKRSIRTGGLAKSIRSAVWLSILYGPKPWKSDVIAPHHLNSSEKRKQIYETLLVKLGTRMADGLLSEDSPSISNEDEQLVVWLQEIDVDIVRTCNKDIYAQDVAEEWDASFSNVIKPITIAQSERDVLESMVATALQDDPIMINPDLPVNRILTRREDLENKIRRVLRAYVMYNPRVGYLQGMNFLVRLLMEVAEDEADCFWLFVGLSEPENDRNLYEPGLAVLQPLFHRFQLFFSKQKPELYEHLEQEGVPIASYTARWFLTFFSTFETFGPTLVIRILDLFVIDNWQIILSMALVVLDELEDVLLKADMEGILHILQFPRQYMVEPDHRRRKQLIRHALAFSMTIRNSIE